MRRTAVRSGTGTAPGEPVPSPSPSAPGSGAGAAEQAPAAAAPALRLQTEFPFELPRGYVDEAGTVHRDGVMRLATARDELVPLRDIRVQENPAYLSVVLLGRVITRLGTLPLVHDGVVENMFASDLAFLQDFYRQINAEGHTRAAVECPHCAEPFEVELGGSRLGES
ncbi:hypothetical protein [Streptomyces olivochromogenes]|uniref:hypothetical protein n=1 Tax=Streptomyces olivochromogenes TaxID=1963 RepID=UPI001F42C9A0|nr:hypothetical protein [Streptomyces olivochromogenes]MCF3133987.1 hypothetical protein [Streptomyces olivochromogenes]